jgi:hypothetical protein
MSEKTNHAANAAGYRAKAADRESAGDTMGSPEQRHDARKSQQALTALADNEDWLAANADKVILPGPMGTRSSRSAARAHDPDTERS